MSAHASQCICGGQRATCSNSHLPPHSSWEFIQVIRLSSKYLSILPPGPKTSISTLLFETEAFI